VDDDECIHGLTPTTCSLCRAKNAPKPVKPAPAPRRAATPRASGGASRTGAPKRPTTVVSTGKVAGRAYFFGSADARGVWWVDQTDSFEDEWSEGVVRAERPFGAAAVPAASRNVGEIRTGDLTIHVVKGEIIGVGVATGDGTSVASPAGWLAPVAVELLDEPVEVRPLATEYKPGPPHPFTNQGFVQPGTCFPYPPAVAERLARKVLGSRLPADAADDWVALATT
jgi:hypothetical protein